MTKKIKCKYCDSEANNATTKKGLYVCCCYLLQNRDGTLTQYERGTQKVLFSKKGAQGLLAEQRVCCNCGNNIRVKDDYGSAIRCECAIDGHSIDYVECFEHWCRRWKKDRSWDEEKERES